MVNVLDCDIVVSKFDPQSHYYTHFQTNTLEKGMNLLMDWIVQLLLFDSKGFAFKVDITLNKETKSTQ